jgi:3',5'-cyclic AMP phosphodiesterase CpdA
MIIAHISDSHIALDSLDCERRLSDLAVTVDDINRLEPPPDVIVHTGDIVHNGLPEEYAAAAAILARVRAPLYVLAGNKDDRANLRAAFSAGGYLAPGFEFIQYAVDSHPLRLIVLDTKSEGNKGDFCRRRLEHLQDLLGSGTTRPVAVFTHHPPFVVSEGPEPFHFEDWSALVHLRDAQLRCGRVVAIFSGHVHRAVCADVDGIPAAVLPAIATSLRHGPYPPHLKSQPVYQVHRFDPLLGLSTETRIAFARALPVL